MTVLPMDPDHRGQLHISHLLIYMYMYVCIVTRHSLLYFGMLTKITTDIDKSVSDKQQSIRMYTGYNITHIMIQRKRKNNC